LERSAGAKAYLFWSTESNQLLTRRDLLFESGSGIEHQNAGEEYDAYIPLFENPTKELLERDNPDPNNESGEAAR